MCVLTRTTSETLCEKKRKGVECMTPCELPGVAVEEATQAELRDAHLVRLFFIFSYIIRDNISVSESGIAATAPFTMAQVHRCG